MFKKTQIFRSFASSLKLPRSSFPPRPDLGQRPALLKQCTDDLYAWQRSKRPAEDEFILHDGPPYANGNLHIGHALNKILKDIFNRFQLSQGKRVHYLPGWDCHGLPIELRALQENRKHGAQSTSIADPVSIRRAAEVLAARTVTEQEASFKSWAIMGDWENSYKTMNPNFEIMQLEVFKELVKKGLIFRQYKPVFWSPSTSTALADAELEYNDHHVSTSAYVKFQLLRLPDALRHLEGRGDCYALVWTTTPWTLPANAAIAFHSDLEYAVIRDGDDFLISGASLIEQVAKARGIQVQDVPVECVVKGIMLRTAMYHNSFRDLKGPRRPFLHADFVTAESGTGLVHMAPGHGHDDYHVCKAANLDVFAPVDGQGQFTADAYPEEPLRLQGKAVLQDGTTAVLDILGDEGLLWAVHKYSHKYPIDWRTKQPVIIRATAQWFANVDKVKDHALEALDAVEFIPDSGRMRLQSFVKGRNDWCISRQRAWGVPIPALFRSEGIDSGAIDSGAIMTTVSVEHIIKVIKERGIEAWFTDPPDDPAWVAPSLPRANYTRGTDTMDVWFDSGSTWTQIPRIVAGDAPADVYLEGTDQHRGWFQSSLLTNTAYFASAEHSKTRAPFRRLLTHGFTLDKHGRKMSKSIGNVISPEEIMKGTLLPPLKLKKRQRNATQGGKAPHDALGPDMLRLWVASNDYTNDVLVGEAILQTVTTSLHKYRVTVKWLLGVLADYEPVENTASSSMSDRMALLHLEKVTQAVHSAYISFEPHKAIRALDRYMATELSSFYFEYAKDVLYTAPQADRSRVQSICFEVLRFLLAMLAPATPLLVAEALHHASPSLSTLLQNERQDPFKGTWVPYCLSEDYGSSKGLSLENQAGVVASIRSVVRDIQESVRKQGKVGSGLECQVQVIWRGVADAPPELQDLLIAESTATQGSSDQCSELAGALVVSQAGAISLHDFNQRVQEGERSRDTAATSTVVSVEASDEEVHGLAHSLAQSEGLPWAAGRQIEGKITLSGEAKPFRLQVLVAPMSNKQKCPRCWRFAVDAVGKDPHNDAEQVCRRCKEALAENDRGSGGV